MSDYMWLGSGPGAVGPPGRPNVVGDNKRAETLNVALIHGGYPSGLPFLSRAQWGPSSPGLGTTPPDWPGKPPGGDGPFPGYKHCDAHQVNVKHKYLFVPKWSCSQVWNINTNVCVLWGAEGQHVWTSSQFISILKCAEHEGVKLALMHYVEGHIN